MMATRALRAAAAGRTPMIQFVGRRSIPESIDHAPRSHPQDPQASLPKSFAEYRIRASQHGPLTGYKTVSSSTAIPSKPKEGEYSDRNDLPKRFWRLRLSKPEMQAIEDGAALI